MICLALGLGVLGFCAMRKAHRCHAMAMGYGPHYGGWHGHGGWQRRGWGGGNRRRWMLNAMLSRIDATPAQERAIVNELDQLEHRVRGAKSGLRDARGDLAAAVRGPSLDDGALGGALGRLDATTAEVRAAALDALRNIHAVLDDRQREQVADIIDSGWWRRGGGAPYRV